MRNDLQRAFEHHRAGELKQAEALYRQVLISQPDHPDALNLLGLIAVQNAQYKDALQLFERAIHINPDFPDYHNNRGGALRALQRLDQAIAAHQQALALNPDLAESHNHLGAALYEAGRSSEAASAFRKALALKPDFAEACNNLGMALQAQGQLADAAETYRRALALDPAYAEARNNLGVALQAQGKLTEAISCLKQALRLTASVDMAQLEYNLGNVFHEAGQLDEAVTCYRRALSLKPDHTQAHSNLLMSMVYQAGLDSAAVLAEHKRWATVHTASLPTPPPHRNAPDPERRLRIGYVSPDFCQHPVAFFTEPLLARHDPNDFEIYCYSDVDHPDSVTTRLQALGHVWRNIVGITDEQLAEQVRDDQVDILVDLAGHTAGNRLLGFARKPAPVQVSYLGYPNTTGLDGVDYRFSDAWADPLEKTDAYYSESLVRLPHGFACYQPPIEAPPVSALSARETGRVTFSSLNHVAKITPQVVALWAEILKQIPDARLLLQAGAFTDAAVTARVRQQFARAGAASERVELIPSASLAEHLALYHHIDIALDTFPWNGHTTTCHALWMGVPVVVLAGDRHAARMGVSVLSVLDLPELIADTPESYVEISLRLAGNLERLAGLRSGLRQRMKDSPLTDSLGFARSVEAAYRSMWKAWCVNQ
ncbi:MAG: tetratricopeptide repeat protein [Acidiferrobacterales bacterium]